MAERLSHFDADGASRMVDVGEKAVTRRIAVASGSIVMRPETLIRIKNHDFAKGNVLEVARLAGIMGAKQTGALIPLCHPLALEGVEVRFEFSGESVLGIQATARIEAKTGVEMEALTAVSVAALTVYDMCKSIDRTMRIENIQLESKSGGKSGDFERPTDDAPV